MRAARDKPYARSPAAQHPTCTADVLAALAADPDARVRTAVAQHPAAPVAALARLATDNDADLLAAVLGHPRSTDEVRSVAALAQPAGTVHEQGRPTLVSWF